MSEIGTNEAKTAPDYSAELYVAGKFAHAGWNVYFPHRDKGFDFIVTKENAEGEYRLRPVQVKGKYPTEGKGDKDVYGYIGELTQIHREMVLVIPFFKTSSPLPVCIAYMPRTAIKEVARGFKCQPAMFRNGSPMPRRDYAQFFDEAGLRLLEASFPHGVSAR